MSRPRLIASVLALLLPPLSLSAHLRGQGLLKLDRSDRVRGSALTLAEIRRSVRQAR
jgi:hypothetical protein